MFFQMTLRDFSDWERARGLWEKLLIDWAERVRDFFSLRSGGVISVRIEFVWFRGSGEMMRLVARLGLKIGYYR